MTIDYFLVMQEITATHARRKGLRADIPSAASAEERAVAHRSLDVATALCPVDPCERARMNAEEHEDCGAGELDRRTRGEP